MAQATDLIAAALAKHHGTPVDRDDIASVHVSRVVSEEEFQAAEVQEFGHYSERFRAIDAQRAFILAAWLFPPIRPYLEGPDRASLPMLSDPDAITTLGPLALHDDTWAELEARFQVGAPPAKG